MSAIIIINTCIYIEYNISFTTGLKVLFHPSRLHRYNPNSSSQIISVQRLRDDHLSILLMFFSLLVGTEPNEFMSIILSFQSEPLCISTNPTLNKCDCSYMFSHYCIPATVTQQCAMHSKERMDCGTYGIRKHQCLAMGCCWQPINENGIPWCFHEKSECC